ncbi:MAG: HlyD family efflux transporter periplasmic adaptor subunit [Planctomycetaceae bacterium]
MQLRHLPCSRLMHGDHLAETLDRLRDQCERLLESSSTVESYLAAALPLIDDCPGVIAIAVWLRDDQSRPRPVAGHQLAQLTSDGRVTIDATHQQLLQQTLTDGLTRVVNDRQSDPGTRPHSLFLAGIRQQDAGVGVIELYAAPSPTPAQTAFFQAVAELFSSYASVVAAGTATAQSDADVGPEFWERFEQFVLQLQRSLDLREVSAIAVNDTRYLLGCDRVSIVTRHGPRARVLAISGQDDVQPRANQTKALARLADAVMIADEPITYRGTLDRVAPTLEEPLADYLVESRSRMVHLVPMREIAALPRHEDRQHDERPVADPRRVIGCLVIEQSTAGRPRPGLLERSELLAEHVAAALANARRHESVFLLPLWRGLGRGIGWFRGRRLWIAAALVLGLMSVAAALTLIPWVYRVEAKGQALPVTRHGLFAPRDAEVEAVLVESNQRVTAGTPLVRLDSAELDQRRAELVGEVARLAEEALNLRREQDEARRMGDREGEQLAYTRARQARIDLAARQRELAIVDDELARLVVTAPADGVVATFGLRELLSDRPVSRGELLMEVMDDRGEWRLELHVPEHRMGHLLAAHAAESSGRLPVEYTPATDSRLTLKAVLADIATRVSEQGEDGSVVRVYATIDPDDLPGRRIGAEVDARILCGRKSLFYCLFGDVVEFVQRRVWW